MSKFKKIEWYPFVNQRLLKETIQTYYNEYNLEETGGWNRKDIIHFLSVNSYLFPDRNAKKCHIDTIESLILEMVK